MAQRYQFLFEERWRRLLGGSRKLKVLGRTVFRSCAGNGGDWSEVSFGVNSRRTNDRRGGVLQRRRDRLFEKAPGRITCRHSSASAQRLESVISKAAPPRC